MAFILTFVADLLPGTQDAYAARCLGDYFMDVFARTGLQDHFYF